MPKIQRSSLPPALRDHLFDRVRERKITTDDSYQLKLRRETDPAAPDGSWYKDFGSFKICGEGKYPKTFLPRGQPAKGLKLEDWSRKSSGPALRTLSTKDDQLLLLRRTTYN